MTVMNCRFCILIDSVCVVAWVWKYSTLAIFMAQLLRSYPTTVVQAAKRDSMSSLVFNEFALISP